MLCLEYYCKRALLLGGFPLEEASDQGIHSGNKNSFLLFFLHYLAYVWYFYANWDISVLQVVSKPFPGPTRYRIFFLLVANNWGRL